MRIRLLAATLLSTGLLFTAAALPAAADAVDGKSSTTAVTLEARQAAWEARPGDILAGIRLQNAYRKAGKPRSAISLFKAKLAEAPDDLARSFLYGRAKGDLGRMRAALAKNLGRSGGDTAGLLDAWIAMLAAEVAAGNAAEAETAALRITAMRGKAADWTYLGWVQEALVGNDNRAIASYMRALEVTKHHVPASNALVLLLVESDKAKDAVVLARATAGAHPRNASAQLHLGIALATSGDLKGAAKAYDRALACAGENADLLAEIGAGYLDVEQLDLAYKALAKALGLDPDHGEALTSMATVALDRGDVSGAAKYLKRAARQLPKDAHVAYLQGVCAQRQNRHTSAIRYFRKAMAAEPESVEYLVVLALAYVKKGSAGSAVPLLKKAIQRDCADPELRLQLGIAYMKTRKYKLARASFEQMVTMDTKDPRPHYYLAIIWGDRMDKAKEALAELEIYESLGGKEPTALTWLTDLRTQLGKD